MRKTCYHRWTKYRFSFRTSDSIVAYIEYIHTRLHEAIYGVSGRTNDRLVLVKRRIEDKGHTRKLIKIGDQLIVARIQFP